MAPAAEVNYVGPGLSQGWETGAPGVLGNQGQLIKR